MRALAVFLATALAVASVTPALASVGLPRLGELRAGPHEVVLYNDSPALIAGRNTLSLQLPPGLDRAGVRLVLLGAAGQALPVGMRPVVVLGGAEAHGDTEEGTHAAEGPTAAAPFGRHTHAPAPTAAPVAPGHASGGDGHGDGHSSASSEATGPGRHEPTAVAPGTMLRGTVTVPSAGQWRASLTVTDHAEVVHTAETTLDAIQGGPNRLYLLATGLLIGGSLIVGVAGRHLALRRSVARSSKPGR